MVDRFRLTWFYWSRAILFARENWRRRGAVLVRAVDRDRILREEMPVPLLDTEALLWLGLMALWG